VSAKFRGLEDVLTRTRGLSVLDDFWVDQVGNGVEFGDVDLKMRDWDDIGEVRGKEFLFSPEFTWPGLDGSRLVRGDGEGNITWTLEGNLEVFYVTQAMLSAKVNFPAIMLEEGSVLCDFRLGWNHGVESFLSLPLFGYAYDVYNMVRRVCGGSESRMRQLLGVIVFDTIVCGKIRDLGLIGLLQDEIEFVVGNRIRFLPGNFELVKDSESNAFVDSYIPKLAKAAGVYVAEDLVDFEFQEIDGCGVSEERLELAGEKIRNGARKFIKAGEPVSVGFSGKGSAMNLF
jgi:hypothetical protein